MNVTLTPPTPTSLEMRNNFREQVDSGYLIEDSNPALYTRVVIPARGRWYVNDKTTLDTGANSASYISPKIVSSFREARIMRHDAADWPIVSQLIGVCIFTG
jgi:hypothetical protein